MNRKHIENGNFRVIYWKNNVTWIIHEGKNVDPICVLTEKSHVNH